MWFSPSDPVSSTGTVLSFLSHQGRGGIDWLCCLVVSPRPPLWIADQVRNDGWVLRLVLACSPASPLLLWIADLVRNDGFPPRFCLKARMTVGYCVWFWLVHSCYPAALWIADQVCNDVTMLCIVFTLTFDSSPIKGEGDWWVCLVVPTLWV